MANILIFHYLHPTKGLICTITCSIITMIIMPIVANFAIGIQRCCKTSKTHTMSQCCSHNARGVNREGSSSHMQASCQLAQLVENGCNGRPAV